MAGAVDGLGTGFCGVMRSTPSLKVTFFPVGALVKSLSFSIGFSFGVLAFVWLSGLVAVWLRLRLTLAWRLRGTGGCGIATSGSITEAGLWVKPVFWGRIWGR